VIEATEQQAEHQAPAITAEQAGIGARGWRRYLVPSLSDCLFVFIIFWLFVAGQTGWERLLGDGDTGWHIRIGESILRTGSVPWVDPFSFSKPGAPWYAWEWLSDIGLAVIHGHAGLRGVSLAGGLLIALFGLLLVRYTIWRGANVLAALVFGLVGFGAASIHYLARPHLLTMVFLVIALWVIERDRRRPSVLLWLLVPFTALWTNLHGGFPALLVCIGILAVGSAVETWLGRFPGPRDWRSAKRYTLLGAGCAAASLVNPYGIELHRHILSYVRSDWIKDVVMEFQSPSFRTENVFQFEALLFLGLMAAMLLVARRRVVEAGWIIAWAHFSLSSIRHIPIFVIVAVPVIATEATRLWNRWSEGAGPKSARSILRRISEDLEPGFRRTSLWPLLVVLFLMFGAGWMRWPKDFPSDSFPTAIATRNADRIMQARIFTDDQWADYLIYRFYPVQRVFFDGRSDFYGPEIGDQYIALMNGKRGWKQILAKNRFDVVLSRTEWPLASLLKQSPEWRIADSDEKAILFVLRRKTSASDRQPEVSLPPLPDAEKIRIGLMKQTLPAESTRGDREVETGKARRESPSSRPNLFERATGQAGRGGRDFAQPLRAGVPASRQGARG